MAENIYSAIERLEDRLDDQEELFNDLSTRLDKLENPVKVVGPKIPPRPSVIHGLDPTCMVKQSRFDQLERMERRLQQLADEEGRKPFENHSTYTLWDKLDNIVKDTFVLTQIPSPVSPQGGTRFMGYDADDIGEMEDFKVFLRGVVRENWNKSPQIWAANRFAILNHIDNFVFPGGVDKIR